MPQEELIDEAKGFASRDDTMDNILASREEDLKQEVEDSGGELLEDKDEKDTPDKEDDDVENAQVLLDAEKPDEKEDPETDETVELIVDGEKKSMKVSEVVAIAQKNMAADARLAEAERKNREADENLKLKTEEAPADPIIDESNDELIIEKRKAYLHAMNYGEPEEQEEAMIEWEKTVKGDGGASVDKETLKAEIKEELSGDQIRNRFNLPESQGGFGDIMSDPVLRDGCFAQIDEAIKNGADHSDWETYSNVAIGIRDKYIIKESEPKKPASDAFEEKKKRKTKVDNLETASDTKSSGSKESNPQSSEGLRSDTIADIAQGRPGQTNY